MTLHWSDSVKRQTIRVRIIVEVDTQSKTEPIARINYQGGAWSKRVHAMDVPKLHADVETAVKQSADRVFREVQGLFGIRAV